MIPPVHFFGHQVVANLSAVDAPPASSNQVDGKAVPVRVYFVRVADIDCIETASNCVRLHSGKNSHLLRESLSSPEARLDPKRFLRIHRTTVVNVERLRELQPWFSGEFIAILQDGTRLKVSRGYRDRVARWLGQTL